MSKGLENLGKTANALLLAGSLGLIASTGFYFQASNDMENQSRKDNIAQVNACNLEKEGYFFWGKLFSASTLAGLALLLTKDTIEHYSSHSYQHQ